MDNPYKILECSRFDSLENIKRNGKRLMFKHHPDKNDSGESEQFIKIQHAYQTVLKEKEKEDFVIKQFHEISYAMLAFVNVYMSYCLTKPKKIQINMKVSLEDVVNKLVKRIVYKRYVSGRLKRETVYVDLSAFQKTYIFEQLGDENVFMKTFGDLEINLILSKTSGKFEKIEIVDDYNIKSIMRIDLYEYLYGTNIIQGIHHTPYIHGEEISIPTLIQDTQLHITFRLKISLDPTALEDVNFKSMIHHKFHEEVFDMESNID